MSRLLVSAACLLALTAGSAGHSTAVAETDLRRAVPADVHLAAFMKRNAERDYQREYFREVLETVEEERIGERIIKLVASHVPEDKLDKAHSAWQQIADALEPINAKALADAEECVFAQRMRGPFNQQLFAMRLSEEEADHVVTAMRQLFDLAGKWSEGKVSIEESETGDATITTLRLPKESPFHPSVARYEGIVILSTSPDFVRESVELLTSKSGATKFDDPRFKEAMEHLPEPEDAVVFFDGRQMWKSLHGIGDFIREQCPDDEKGQRAAKLLDRVVDEVAILDYEITVGYTEDGQNRSTAIGQLTEDAEQKLLGKALTQGEAFDDWQSWIPADAKSFKLTTGVNLHELYTGVLEILREDFPESHEALDKFAEAQEDIDLDIDEDILQSFSGECISMRLAVEDANGKDSQQGVTALKCKDPEGIRKLLDRAVEALNEIPAVKAQGLELADCEDLDGFQEVRSMVLKTVGVRPVIGFNDGWMIVSSHADAAKQFLAVRAGEEDSIADSDTLEDFDIEADKPVYAAGYADIGAGIRAAADAIDKAGMMAPMFLGMAAAQADKEDMAAIQEAIGLLPSLAKVVRKFDFFEDRLSITQEGPLPDSYLKQTVMQIREPEEDSDDE